METEMASPRCLRSLDEPGRGRLLAPIDHDGNGLTDYLVLSGAQETPGPVQLIAIFRNASATESPAFVDFLCLSSWQPAIT